MARPREYARVRLEDVRTELVNLAVAGSYAQLRNHSAERDLRHHDRWEGARQMALLVTGEDYTTTEEYGRRVVELIVTLADAVKAAECSSRQGSFL